VATGLIVVITDPRSTAPRAARAAQLLMAGNRLGMPTAAIVSDGARSMVPDAATTAGRIVVSALSGGDSVTAVAEAALSTAVALQLLTLSLLTLHGQNPDLIGRETDDQRESAAIASASFPL
jgi:hypothetical protein